MAWHASVSWRRFPLMMRTQGLNYLLARVGRLARPRDALGVGTADVSAGAAVLGVRIQARGLARVRRVGVAQAEGAGVVVLASPLAVVGEVRLVPGLRVLEGGVCQQNG